MLFFAFLLNIESFSAVVSDNDGSAFITKAEFDSLKNIFQSQLDSYNENIDTKIDNAIASYLIGIKIQKQKQLIFLDPDWKDIYEINGQGIANKYDAPYKNFILNIGYTNYQNTWTSTAHYNAKLVDTIKNTQTRALVEAFEQETYSYDNVYPVWQGLNTEFIEEMSCTTMGTKYNTTSSTEYYFPGAGVNLLRFNLVRYTRYNDGYKESNGSRWTATIDRWINSGSTAYSGEMSTLEWKYVNNNFIVAPNDKYKYKHIMCFDSMVPIGVTDKDWLKVWYVGDDDQDSAGNYKYWYQDNWTIEGLYGYCENTDAGATANIGRNLAANLLWPAAKGSTTSTDRRPHVGLLPSLLDHTKLVQIDGTRIVEDEGTNYYGPYYETLGVGYAAFFVKKDTKFSWDLTINDCLLNPCSASPTAYTDGKYRIYLSIGGFGSGTSPAYGATKLTHTEEGVEYDYWETTNNSVSIKNVEIPESGILYIKWRPSDSSVTTTNWISRFNQDDNANAYYTEEE